MKLNFPSYLSPRRHTRNLSVDLSLGERWRTDTWPGGTGGQRKSHCAQIINKDGLPQRYFSLCDE